MLILVGHSASGKTEIANALIKKYGIKKIITHTTRAKRQNENDGIDYYFHSEEEFLALKNKNFFIETTFFNDSYYGTAKEDIKDDRIIILDPPGLDALKKLNLDNLYAVFLKADRNVRFDRMIKRGDKKEDILIRLAHDQEKFSWEKLRNIDATVDSNIMSISYLSDLIYNQYMNIIRKGNNNE